jgi:hypothetical protein
LTAKLQIAAMLIKLLFFNWSYSSLITIILTDLEILHGRWGYYAPLMAKPQIAAMLT